MQGLRAVLPPSMPIHFHTHATSGGSIATCMEMSRQGCDVIDCCTAALSEGTSQPSMNAFTAMCPSIGIDYMSLEHYDLFWMKARGMYASFESGMLSTSARVYDHQIPGGQYSNLLVQCKSMGLIDDWATILNAYRDANHVLGNIVKVTPSSKCVGDLALYLVNKKVSAADILDPIKGAALDYPESVVDLLKGGLGFPHRGFPSVLSKNILKGDSPITTRAGLILKPISIDERVASLQEMRSKAIATGASDGTDAWTWEGSGGDSTIGKFDAMCHIMYPKVFEDYLARCGEHGTYLRHLPSDVYFHGMVVGREFDFVPYFGSNDHSTSVSTGSVIESGLGVKVGLARVGPVKGGSRAVEFTITTATGATHTYIHKVKVKSTKFVFTGIMASPDKANELPCPMPGVVEKAPIASDATAATTTKNKDGSTTYTASPGDVIAIISAMKMEVKVTVPDLSVLRATSATISDAGTVQVKMVVKQADQVVEGALVATIV